MGLSAYFAVGYTFVICSNDILSTLVTEVFSRPGTDVLSLPNGTAFVAELHRLSIGFIAVVSTLVRDAVRDVRAIKSDDGCGKLTKHVSAKDRVS